MNIILIIIIALALLDTIIGNYWFPGKEGIVETNDGKYKLYKYNRILLIPIKMWDDCVGKFGMSCLIYFTFYYKNGGVSDNFDSAGNIKPNATTYTVGEVKEGIDYAILLTTCAGAWRYLIGDTIKFVDAEQCKLIITGRTKHFLSICGEHLSIDNMNQALQAVQRNLNISIREFTVNGERRTNQYSHKWYISVEKPFNKNIVAEELDRQLQLLNDDYKAVRKAVLDKISVETLTPSVFYDYLKSKNKLGGQSKFPRVMNNEQFKDWELFVKSVVELV